MGRPSFQPTAQQRTEVRALVQARVVLEEIARRLHISKKTLTKHFAAEINGLPAGTKGGEKTPDRVNTLPPFTATAEQREIVEILSATPLSREEIAQRVGVPSVAILEFHFADELAKGPSRRNADVILATYRAATGGNVSAQRLWLAISAPSAGEGNKPERPTLAGKKAQANAAAKDAEQGTDWESVVH